MDRETPKQIETRLVARGRRVRLHVEQLLQLLQHEQRRVLHHVVAVLQREILLLQLSSRKIREKKVGE